MSCAVIALSANMAVRIGRLTNTAPDSWLRLQIAVDPQVAHRGALAEVQDGGGTFKVLNLPFRMSGATVSAAKRMSTLGEHTRSYLREIGLADAEIAKFADKARG